MATVGGVSLGGFAYSYDATGRIVERDLSLGDPASPSNSSLSSQMSQSSHKTYSYDSLDRLAMDGDVSYTYDAAGNRLSKIDPAQGTTLYTLGIGDRLATYGRARSPSAPQPGEGSYAYAAAGNVMYIIAYFDYDAWGNILSATSSVPALARNRYRFQGREWSAATGLMNFRMRWYDAETGRWVSKDPIGLSGGLNLYEFNKCDSVNYSDPNGTDIWIGSRGLHQNINIGNPSGNFVSYSFGVDDSKPWSYMRTLLPWNEIGVVYKDSPPDSNDLDNYLPTTPGQDGELICNNGRKGLFSILAVLVVVLQILDILLFSIVLEGGRFTIGATALIFDLGLCAGIFYVISIRVARVKSLRTVLNLLLYFYLAFLILVNVVEVGLLFAYCMA